MRLLGLQDSGESGLCDLEDVYVVSIFAFTKRAVMSELCRSLEGLEENIINVPAVGQRS